MAIPRPPTLHELQREARQSIAIVGAYSEVPSCNYKPPVKGGMNTLYLNGSKNSKLQLLRIPGGLLERAWREVATLILATPEVCSAVVKNGKVKARRVKGGEKKVKI